MKRLPRWEGKKGVTAGSVNSWKHLSGRIFCILKGTFRNNAFFFKAIHNAPGCIF